MKAEFKIKTVLKRDKMRVILGGTGKTGCDTKFICWYTNGSKGRYCSKSLADASCKNLGSICLGCF